jgi:hypothetical protein
MKAQQSGGQMFWRVRARREEGREAYSDWKRLVIQDHHFPEE